MQVKELLRVGKNNSVSRTYLKEVLGIDERTLYAQVARERKNGAIILTDGKRGYYLPDQSSNEGQAEIAAFKRRMMSMGISTIIATRGARKVDG